LLRFPELGPGSTSSAAEWLDAIPITEMTTSSGPTTTVTVRAIGMQVRADGSMALGVHAFWKPTVHRSMDVEGPWTSEQNSRLARQSTPG
jgi:hypothetical protein